MDLEAYLDREDVPADVREAINREITARKQADDDASRTKEYFEKMFNSVVDSVFVIDMNRQFILCNNATERIFGYKKEELIGKSAELVYSNRQAFEDVAYNIIKEIREQGYSKGELILRRKDDTSFPAFATASLLIDTDGKPMGIVVTVRDITERKQAEEKIKEYTENLEKLVEDRTKELKESEVKLEAILSGIGDFITIQNKDLNIIWANPPVRDLWGDVIGKKCYKTYKGLTDPCPDCTVEKVFKEGKMTVSERVSTLPDGTCINILVTSSPVRDAEGKIIAVVEVDKDITERKKLESQLSDYTENLEKIAEERTKELMESEAKQQAILSAIGDLITIQNKELDIIWTNQPEKAIYGDVIGHKCYKAYKGLDAPCPNCTVETVFNEEKTMISEGMIIRPDGRPMNILTTSSAVRDAEGNIVAVLEAVKDITERKQLEQQLKDYADNLEKMVAQRTKALNESEEKLKALLRGIGDRITIQNKNLDIIWINQPVKDIFGDITGQKCYEAYKGLTEPCSDCYAGIVFNEGKTLISERIDIRPEGRYIDTLVTSSPVKDAEGNVVAIIEVTKDITERKKMEKQLKDYTENLEKIVEKRTKALKESEEKQKAILRGIGDLITIQNKDLDVIWANQPIKDLWGDVIGKKCYEVYKCLDEPCPECTVEKVFNEGKTVVTERTSTLPDASQIQILTSSSPVRDAEGNIIAVVEVLKDVTERKQLEVKLRESEERYRGLYESSLDGIVSLDMDGCIVECNQAFANFLGYTKEELYDLTVFDLTPDSWLDSNKKFHDQLLTLGYSEEYEKEYIKKDGSIVSVAIRGWSINNKDDKTTGMWGIVRDITERKRAEKKLREYTENLETLIEERTLDLKASEERYRGLYESSIDGIASLDIDGNIEECNQAYANMLGYTKEELYNLSYQDLTPDRWYDMETRIFATQILPRGYSDVYEKEHIKKDGEIFPVSVRDWLIKDNGGTPTGMWTIVRDISERKKLERQLKKYTKDLEASEERYRGLYESSLDGIVFLDLEGNILECNQALADMLEYTKKELYNLNYRKLLPSKLYDFVAKTLADQMFTKGYSDELETEAIKKDGTTISVSVKAWRIKDKESNPLGMWTIIHDISERKKLESQLKNYAENLEKLVEERTERLRESEERYRGLYESSIDGIFSADMKRNILECNQAFADMLGYTKEELCKFSFWDFTPKKWNEIVDEKVHEQVFSRGYSEAYEQEAISKDGKIIPISVRVWSVKDNEDRPIGVWGIVRDITDHKRAEDKIREYTEKL